MKGRILKFSTNNDNGPILIPAPAQILHVAFQHGKPTVWALVPNNTPSFQAVHFFYTGVEVPSGRFIGTLVSDDQTFVLHAFVEDQT